MLSRESRCLTKIGSLVNVFDPQLRLYFNEGFYLQFKDLRNFRHLYHSIKISDYDIANVAMFQLNVDHNAGVRIY